MNEKIIAVSGYFIILHIGHIEYFKQASKYGKVVVILNNDHQQFLKYGRIILSLKERAEVLKSIKYVYKVFRSIDEDRTVCKTLEILQPDYFGNGGDRTDKNVPEMEICDKFNIQMIFGLGDKIQSSSELLKKI